MSAAKSGERAGNLLVSDLGTALVRAGVPAPTDQPCHFRLAEPGAANQDESRRAWEPK